MRGKVSGPPGQGMRGRDFCRASNRSACRRADPRCRSWAIFPYVRKNHRRRSRSPHLGHHSRYFNRSSSAIRAARQDVSRCSGRRSLTKTGGRTKGCRHPALSFPRRVQRLTQIDFDYLLRDSYSSGTDYGRFDDRWLIEHLQLDGDKPRFCLSHKGLMAAEAYVFARHHMYRTVYFHKTTCAAEVMLRLIFKRFKCLLDEASSKSAKAKTSLPASPPVSYRRLPKRRCRSKPTCRSMIIRLRNS